MIGVLITAFIVVMLGSIGGGVAFMQYRKTLREAKNYERGLKMVPMLIHLPPTSEDIEGSGRDERDLTEEILSQAQVMYSIIASTATKGFKSRIYGQRHVSFEIVARRGLIYYYVVVPTVLIDVVRQAITAAYPSARLEEVAEHTIFSDAGKMSGTIGGEFTLKKDYVYPIETYQDAKRDASRALLNALAAAGRDDGIGVQLLIRPAKEGWTKNSAAVSDKITKDKTSSKKSGLAGILSPKDLVEALWKPPEAGEKKEEEHKSLSSIDQAKKDAIESKTNYPGYETLIRVVVSSNTAGQSQALLQNVVSAFALFNSPNNNGFKFAISKNIEELVTAYIFRFFPQNVTQNVLNSVELSTIFHLPSQSSIPSSKVQRQISKQVDGPTQIMDEGVLLGYNEFRGTKKPIRLSTNDRRRHTYIIGQTGTGKSVLLENIAYQDMLDGKGFAFVDPHGDSVEALLGKVPKERVEDVIYFNPGDMTNPIGLNMFEFDNPDQKDFLVQEAINMLYGLYDPGHTGIVGPRLEHIFRNCALLLMSDPAGGTFIDIPKLLVDPEFMKSKLKYVTDQTVLDFWTKEFPASQRSNEAGEVISWVVSKFGPFISNDAMRNIIGQTKSGFNLRDIMDNKKILIVNLSKGRMGELNSKLLGIIFVMKFQAAAMSRANIPEDQRQDFSLFVDEFQNFATDSFESILSEARKYRLNLVLGNQFMTQLTDKIREAIIGNVGTVISGRIGTTDAEIMVKRFRPTFEEDDLTKLPNHQSITSVMINNVPSAPFSMSWIAPMGNPNTQLSDALKRLSAAKYGKSRAEVEKEIFTRLGRGKDSQKTAPQAGMKPAGGSSFLDEWMARREQMKKNQTAGPRPMTSQMPSQSAPSLRPQASSGMANSVTSPPQSQMTPADENRLPPQPALAGQVQAPRAMASPRVQSSPPMDASVDPTRPQVPHKAPLSSQHLDVRGAQQGNDDDEVSVHLR